MELIENVNMDDNEEDKKNASVYDVDNVDKTLDTNKLGYDTSNQGILYKIHDNPPWYLSICLALQNYLTMFSSPIAATFLISPYLCLGTDHPARVHIIATMLFVFGIVTLFQNTIGIRLPIVQGGSFAYLMPVFTILSLPKWHCPEGYSDVRSNGSQISIEEHDEIWMSRMREIQGDIAFASLLQVFIGMTGIIGFLLKWITPLVITPTIALIGLGLFSQAAQMASKNWFISLGSISLMILFSQYLRNVKLKIPFYNRQNGWQTIRYPIFCLLPVLLSVVIMWITCYVLTVTDTLDSKQAARTDLNTHVIHESSWLTIAYPFQWGLPTASLAGIIGMMSAVIASVIESIGDYYACARLSSAPPPPVHAINRGIAVEGFGGILAGIWGTGLGATSLSQNVGAISITKVASRRVIQYVAVMMILFGTFTKLGALFVTIPEPIVGGIYCVMFGIVTAVGISNVQFIDLNSSRNLFILGFSIFFGLAFPNWISQNVHLIKTGNETLDQIVTVLLSTNMLVGGVLGFILDNTIPGSDEERGLNVWREIASSAVQTSDEHMALTYDLPFGMSQIRKWRIATYLPFCPTYGKESLIPPSSNDGITMSSIKTNDAFDA